MPETQGICKPRLQVFGIDASNPRGPFAARIELRLLPRITRLLLDFHRTGLPDPGFLARGLLTRRGRRRGLLNCLRKRLR